MKFYLLQLSASFLKPYALVAVCVLRDAPLRPSKLSTYQKDYHKKSPTDMVQTLSSSTDYQLLAQVKSWVLLVLMVLVNQQPSRFWQVIFNRTWETTNQHLHGKTSLNFSEEVNFKITSQNFLKIISKLLSKFNMSILFLRILRSVRLLWERNLLLLIRKEFYQRLLRHLIWRASLKEKFNICLVESYNALSLVLLASNKPIFICSMNPPLIWM